MVVAGVPGVITAPVFGSFTGGTAGLVPSLSC